MISIEYELLIKSKLRKMLRILFGELFFASLEIMTHGVDKYSRK